MVMTESEVVAIEGPLNLEREKKIEVKRKYLEKLRAL